MLQLDLTEPAPPLDGIAGTRLVGVEAGGLRQRLALAAGTTAAQVLYEVSGRVQVRDLAIDEPDIEDVVRRLYESTGR